MASIAMRSRTSLSSFAGELKGAALQVVVVGVVAALPAFLLGGTGMDRSLLLAVGIAAALPVAVWCDERRRHPAIVTMPLAASLTEAPYRDETSYRIDASELARFKSEFLQPFDAVIFPSRPTRSVKCSPWLFGYEAFRNDVRLILMVNQLDIQYGLLSKALHQLDADDSVGVFCDPAQESFSQKVVDALVANTRVRKITLIKPAAASGAPT